jgi:ABC-2 type transport system ATP-binding protein
LIFALTFHCEIKFSDYLLIRPFINRMLEFKSLSKKFGDKSVIESINLKLDFGIYWLQGPNGSGKTTLLKMIAGLLPFEGNILIDGISQKSSPKVYRQQVSCADAEPLYPGFITGKDLVNLYREVRKVSQIGIDPLIDLFQVRQFLSTNLGSYSSGMIKKLSLLLAFIGEPRLILLDEPLITLELDSIPRIYELIMDYHLHKNTGFLISSHQELKEKVFIVDKKLLISEQTIHLL